MNMDIPMTDKTELDADTKAEMERRAKAPMRESGDEETV